MTQTEQVLFKETQYYCNEWMRLKKELGEFDQLVRIQHARFCALYAVIEESGLEDEYQAWKKGEKNHG